MAAAPIKSKIKVKIFMARKLKPLTEEEHIELAKKLRETQKLLEPYVERLWQAYGLNSKESKCFDRLYKLLSHTVCIYLENQWYKIPNVGKTPYYEK